MVRRGYGAEIAEIVKAIPYEDLIQTEDVAQQFAKRFAMPYDKARTVTNIKLKRLADQGDLKRLQKGVYCHVKQTIFGPVAPDIDQIVARNMTLRNGVRIGYESGAALFNQLGLSTMLPRKVEITTNQYKATLPDGCRIKLGKPIAAVTDRNWRYLQFIDVVELLPDAHIDAEAPELLLAAFMKEQRLDPLTLIFTARKHYSLKTVLRLTDLLMEVNNDPAS